MNGKKWTAAQYADPCVFLLGGFDGLHIGHKKLFDFASAFSLPVGVMTMTGVKGKSLFTLSERREIFAAQGASFSVELSFTDELKNTPKEVFLDRLQKRVAARAFVCGKDFRFGQNAGGTPAFIREYTGIPAYDVDIYEVEGRKVSTTLVKELLSSGKVKEANALLVQPFFLRQTVEEGRKTGRTLGFPTANMTYPEGKFLLKEGVYAAHAFLDGKRFDGIANVGACPTFGVETVRAETYFDGFAGDLYGKEVTVYFDGYLRKIENFGSAQRLQAQLKRDMERVRRGDF